MLKSLGNTVKLQQKHRAAGDLGLDRLGLPEPVARKMIAEAGFSRFTTRDFANPNNAYYEVRP